MPATSCLALAQDQPPSRVYPLALWLLILHVLRLVILQCFQCSPCTYIFFSFSFFYIFFYTFFCINKLNSLIGRVKAAASDRRWGESGRGGVEIGWSLVVLYKAQYFIVNYSACLPLIEILWMDRAMAWIKRCGGGRFEVKCKCVHISAPSFFFAFFLMFSIWFCTFLIIKHRHTHRVTQTLTHGLLSDAADRKLCLPLVSPCLLSMASHSLPLFLPLCEGVWWKKKTTL